MTTFEFNSVDFLIEFCLNEIGLDGLEGCSLTDLFPRLHKSSRTMTSTQSASSLSSLEQINRIFSTIIDNEQQENNAYKNFIWRLLKSRNELRFYIKRSGTGSSSNPAVSSAPSKGKKKSNFQPYNIDETKMINHNGERGFSETYFKRTCVNGLFKDEGGEHFSKTFQECLNEFGSNLIIVADQTVRDKVLCPAFKNLVFENLNDLEYCVLEAIAKSRYEGSTTIGDEGLSSRFNVAPKQLHYILVNLESNGLIKRQVVASEKTRSLVHLTRFALKKKNLMETVCDYLLAIGQRSSGGSMTNHEACSDTFTNIRMNLGLTQKKFKNLIPIAERANIMQRYTGAAPVLTKSSSNKEQVAKPRPVRMVRLTSEFFRSHMTSGGVMSSSGGIGSTNGEEETEEADDDQTSLSSLRRTLGSAQSHNLPLYALMFAKIEQFAKDGVSLKQIGTMFALDFYKSRRMGNNLQAHPEIVTIMKETNKGKTKFQTIVMRKFLALTSKSESAETKSSQEESSTQNKETNEKTNDSETSREQTSEGPPTQPTESDQLLILKREGQPNQSIQALISNRMLNRKKLIIDYLDKHRICTKYDLTREIRTRESAQSLPGSIDAKTTKRMLLALERDKKLHTFEVALKNVSYMCVRAYDIEESDDIYKNYCCTFKRTYDSVDLKSTTAKRGGDETMTTTSRDEDLDTSNNNADDDLALRSSTKLTNSFIESVVADLEVLPHRKKLFIVVPKFQKTIILHRFIHYLLFFYDGVQQSTESKEIEEVETDRSQLSTADIEMMDSCKLPRLNEAYQPITIEKSKKDEEEEEDEDRETRSGSLSWSTFVPPLERTQFPLTDSTGCIFVREIFSCMPLSIFCNLVGIQYVVPGLVPLLKHPQKRHMLVRSLPPRLVAPLLHHRRYLHRLYEILQLMACLGLVTFVDSPCKSIQPVNRDIHSQMVYVHRKVRFYDTSTNRCRDWDSLARLNKANFALYDDSNKSTDELAENERYERCEVEFNTPEDVVNYWRKLLHISMNTYKFSALKYMHERSGSGDRLTKSVCKSRRVEEIEPVWPIEKHGDNMGPGGYDSQLFLSSFKNWTISIGRASRSSTNRTSDTTTTANTTRTRSGRSSTPSAAVAAASSEEPAITKDADLSTAPCSELALIFPFGVFRGIATNEQPTITTTTTSPAYNSAKSTAAKKNRAAAKRKRTETEESPESEVEEPPTKTATTQPQPQAKKQKKLASVKLQKAKYLLDKAAKNKQAALVKQQQQQQPILDDRRATWNAAEDELILLIKCAHMYFLPNERSVPFKLINDVSNLMIPPTPGLEKKVSSFGRRIKMLLKWKANLIYVTNKLELCRQDKQLEAKYGEERAKLRKKSPNDRDPTDLYVRFIRDVKERFLKKKSYSGALTDDVVEQEVGDDDDTTKKIDLPDTMDEFKKKYRILNTQQREMLFKPQSAHFKQPTTDYEITCNTVQSAIHSSILINAKNPRVFESFNLFDKYSDQLLTDVIQKMSRQHKIIAPTKCSELKKKNVTAFSKHIGKAYHISQRYQFKWANVMASSVLKETKKFKDDLVAFKIDQMKKSANHSHHHHHDEEMFDCTDKDDIGMTSFLAHTIDNADLQVQIDVPNKIWVSKLI